MNDSKDKVLSAQKSASQLRRVPCATLLCCHPTHQMARTCSFAVWGLEKLGSNRTRLGDTKSSLELLTVVTSINVQCQ